MSEESERDSPVPAMLGRVAGKREWVEQRFRHLRSLLEPGTLLAADVGLPAADDLFGLAGPRGVPRLLFGIYGTTEIEEALERVGILAALRRKGLGPLQICTDASDPRRQTMQVFSPVGGESALIAETALRLDDFAIDAPFAQLLHGKCFRMLCIQWLLMQNPAAHFTPTRPALPGQHYPGLGIGRQVEDLYLRMAQRLQCDGILNSPEFGHTAVLYSKNYRFLDPQAEGRLLALRRALAPLTLAEGSWALHTGCVLLEGRPQRIFRWVPEEQVLPLSASLQAHFRSRAYVRAVKDAARSHRFLLDAVRFRELRPLDHDGSPRLKEY